MTFRQRFEQYFKPFLYKNKNNFQKFLMATKQRLITSSGGGNKNGNDTVPSKPSVLLVALNLLHRFMILCVRFILVKVKGEHGESMAPIENLILLESATAIAEKIRTKKVSKIVCERCDCEFY